MDRQRKPENVNIRRSPDWTPSDYFLCGRIKNKVHDKSYENTNNLRAEISTVLKAVSSEMVVSTERGASNEWWSHRVKKY